MCFNVMLRFIDVFVILSIRERLFHKLIKVLRYRFFFDDVIDIIDC